MPTTTPPLLMGIRISVSAIIEKDHKILLVKEKQEEGIVYNQPTGYLEDTESLLEGIVREVKEETGLLVKPMGLVGIYHWLKDNRVDVIRFCFDCKIVSGELNVDKDEDVLEVQWYSLDQIKAIKDKLRNPLVEICIHDYFSGKSFSLNSRESSVIRIIR